MSLTLEQYEQLNPRCEVVHNGTRMTFVTPNVFTKWRVEGIRAKEPCTLDWIAGFNPDDVLADVGANVGMYSVWAAATRRTRVIAFEPEAQNYALLNRNILANQLQGRIKAYCMGLSDQQSITDLYLSELIPGGSNHAVGQALDFALAPMKVAYQQGCLTFRLDDLVTSGAVPLPHHIKIDVDGFEHKVIAGAAETLKNPAVRSLMIEVNPNLAAHRAMLDALARLGFKLDAEQVRRATRPDGPFKGVAEHVFKR